MVNKKGFIKIKKIFKICLILILFSCENNNSNQLDYYVNALVKEYFTNSEKLPKVDSVKMNIISKYVIKDLQKDYKEEKIINRIERKDNDFLALINQIIEKHSFPTAFASRHTIINDTTKLKWYNNEFYSFWNPSIENIKEIEEILINAIIENKSDFWITLDETSVKYYGRQYFFFENNERDSMVFINAFCKINDIPTDSNGIIKLKPFDWKTKFMIVEDGGECYWKALINKSKKNYEYLLVN